MLKHGSPIFSFVVVEKSVFFVILEVTFEPVSKETDGRWSYGKRSVERLAVRWIDDLRKMAGNGLMRTA